MTAQITLPREVVEQNFNMLIEFVNDPYKRFSKKEYDRMNSVINESRAALTEQVQPKVGDMTWGERFPELCEQVQPKPHYKLEECEACNGEGESRKWGYDDYTNGFCQDCNGTGKAPVIVETKVKTEQAQPAVNTTGAHATHCYQGEYAHSCKYGNDHCPMQHEQPAQGEQDGSAEFLSKRLGRVANLAGVHMPTTMTHEQIADVAGTILGQIAFKLEAILQSNAERVPLTDARIYKVYASSSINGEGLDWAAICEYTRAIEAEIKKGQQ